MRQPYRAFIGKVVSWVFIASLGLGCGILGWVLDGQRTQRSLIQEAAEASSRLDLEISRLQFFPTILASDVRVVNFLRHPWDSTPDPAQDLLDLVRTQTGADRVFVINRLGRAVLSSPLDASFIGTSHRRRPFFDNAVSGGFGSFLARILLRPSHPITWRARSWIYKVAPS